MTGLKSGKNSFGYKMKVTIITPTYNSASTIAETIDSINCQSYQDISWIIIDGGSNDGTQEIIRNRVEVPYLLISEKDDGIYNAMNKGLDLAEGDIIHILNSDDAYHSESTVTEIVKLFTDFDVDIVCAGIRYIDSTGSVARNWIPEEPSARDIERGWQCPHPGFFVKSCIVESENGFNETYDVSADYEFTTRLVLKYKAFFSEILAVDMDPGGYSSGLLSRIKGNLQVISAMRAMGIRINYFSYAAGRVMERFKQLV